MSDTTGRTNSYTKEKADRFCREIATGKSISKVCSEHKDMPTSSTIARWLMKYERFFNDYMKAKALAMEMQADQMIDLADNTDENNSTSVNKARLQIDTRKWLAMKLLPKIYGDDNNTFLLSGNTKVSVDHTILKAIVDSVKQAGDVQEAEIIKPLISLPKEVPPPGRVLPPSSEEKVGKKK